MGRLHVTGLWHETIMNRGLSALLARLLPYAFFYTATTVFSLGILAIFNDLRFAGSIWTFLPVPFLTAVATALMPEWCQVFSHLFPLTWLFAFYRGIALRGVDLTAELTLYCAFIIYLTMLAAVVALKYLKAHKVFSEHEKLLAE